MMLRSALAAAALVGATIDSLAQPNLTSSTSVPAAGLVVQYNTANDFQSVGASGANVDYDHWNLLLPATGNQDFYYLAPSATPTSALIPSATLLSTDGGSDTLFWALESDGLRVVGIKIDPALGGALNFDDPWLELKLPCTFGTTWSDPTSDNYTASGFPVVRTGTVTGNADAYGSLELPLSAVYPSVLRVHVRRAITDAAAFVTTNRIAHVYSYYIATQPAPIVVLQTDSTQINAGAWAITKRQLAIGNAGMVSVDEAAGTNFTFTAYPNPASEAITLGMSDASVASRRLQVLDQLGRVVMEETLLGDKQSVDVRSLPAGLYSLRLLADGRLLGTSRITVQ